MSLQFKPERGLLVYDPSAVFIDGTGISKADLAALCAEVGGGASRDACRPGLVDKQRQHSHEQRTARCAVHRPARAVVGRVQAGPVRKRGGPNTGDGGADSRGGRSRSGAGDRRIVYGGASLVGGLLPSLSQRAIARRTGRQAADVF